LYTANKIRKFIRRPRGKSGYGYKRHSDDYLYKRLDSMGKGRGSLWANDPSLSRGHKEKVSPLPVFSKSVFGKN